MTKKDYEVVAAAIRQARLDVYDADGFGTHQREIMNVVVTRLSQVFKETNEKFDPKKFRQACNRSEADAFIGRKGYSS